ncbi:MAG: acyl-CoA dehydrogenase family protein [Gammaproteobacteria bacterium]
MHFEDRPEDAAYRAQVRAWLEANAPRKSRPDETWGVHLGEDERVAAAREWQRRKFDAGYGAIAFPRKYGGAGGRAYESVIFQQEESAFLVPVAFYNISLGVCIPSLLALARPEHKERHVRPALEGTEVWCQLYSEPAAGSDLAGILTRAERDAATGDFLINGQKVWTTHARHASWALLVARTDATKAKHDGLTVFIIDMRSPGIEVRPIRQASGEADFNEVFLTDVRVPAANVIGEVDGGWKVIVASLVHERVSIGGALPKDLHRMTLEMAGERIDTDARIRERVADQYLMSQGLWLMSARALTAVSKGQVPGPESICAKIIAGRFLQDFSYFAMDLRGSEGVLAGSELDEAAATAQRMWFGSLAVRIAGGTDEIVRNTIAERVLGLPPEVRVDKGIPFKDLPR